MSKDTRSRNYTPMSQKHIENLLNDIKKEKPVELPEPIVIPPVERKGLKPILHSEEEFDSLQPEDTLREFGKAAREMVARYEWDKTRLGLLESEMQDILHFVEMSRNKDAQKGYQLYKRLCEVRRERRVCKNELDLLQPVYELFHNTKILDTLANTQGQCRQIKQSISNKGYAIRTDVLEDFFET